MENFASDLISLLRYLLPGFLSAWVFYGFTSFQKPSQFERIIQALIFTLIVQVLVSIIRWLLTYIGGYWSGDNWTADTELGFSVALAAVLGFLFAFFANNDYFHKFVRRLGVSQETSYPSEWFGEFKNRVTYVVLHLDDEKRLYGWPREWPSSPEKGHFSIEQASWVTDESEEIQLTGVQSILIPVSDVKMIEFMERTWESTNGKETVQPASPSEQNAAEGQ